MSNYIENYGAILTIPRSIAKAIKTFETSSTPNTMRFNYSNSALFEDGKSIVINVERSCFLVNQYLNIKATLVAKDGTELCEEVFHDTLFRTFSLKHPLTKSTYTLGVEEAKLDQEICDFGEVEFSEERTSEVFDLEANPEIIPAIVNTPYPIVFKNGRSISFFVSSSEDCSTVNVTGILFSKSKQILASVTRHNTFRTWEIPYKNKVYKVRLVGKEKMCKCTGCGNIWQLRYVPTVEIADEKHNFCPYCRTTKNLEYFTEVFKQ